MNFAPTNKRNPPEMIVQHSTRGKIPGYIVEETQTQITVVLTNELHGLVMDYFPGDELILDKSLIEKAYPILN